MTDKLPKSLHQEGLVQPNMAAKIGPARPILAVHVVRGTSFGRFLTKISPAGPVLRGSDFGVTDRTKFHPGKNAWRSYTQ